MSSCLLPIYSFLFAFRLLSASISTLILAPRRQRRAIAVISMLLTQAASSLPSDSSALEISISALKISISALDSAINSLNRWSAFWERLLPFFTAWVVIGVAAEIWLIVWEHNDEMDAWRRGIVRPPDRPSRRKLWLGIGATALVVFGVFGELAVGLVITHINGELRTKNTELRSDSDQLLALVTEVAGDAVVSAHNAATDASDAKKKSDAANQTAGEAQKKADVVTGKAEELDRQLASTKTQVDAVEAKRAELEKSLINMAVCSAPRVISNWMTDGKTYSDPLFPMAGQKVFIEFVPDPETRRAALNLAGTLSNAKWDVQPLRVVDGLEDGVSVQPSMAGTEPLQNVTPQGSSAHMKAWDMKTKASDVADKLVDFLHSYNWQAMRGWPLDAQYKMIHDPSVLPAGAIRIQIGLYPAVTFVSPPGEKDIADAIAQAEKDRQELADKEEKRLEKMFQDVPSMQAALEHRKAERRAEDERISGPCQPLSSLTPHLTP